MATIIKEVNYIDSSVTDTNDESTRCVVIMDKKKHSTNDFVAVLTKENGDASIFYNTDALTLGMAFKMIARAFVDCMNNCTEEEREEISDILGTAFIGDKPDEIAEGVEYEQN